MTAFFSTRIAGTDFGPVLRGGGAFEKMLIDYQREREREEYEERATSTCLDCSRCEVCPWNDGIGWCLEYGEFVNGDDSIADLGADCFEAA